MPDFSKGSTFNKDANFQGVKFGADAPLLETELNELQDIQTEARAEIIRDTTPSGFVQLGELDFDYMLNNENCVKLKTDSVAYVNGYKIKIPKDTIVNIGRAPEKDAREDLLFLEVWKEEVTKDSSLTVAGGEGQASTTNNILDPRVGQETSRRVALKWRIRHVANVDFNKFPRGLNEKQTGGAQTDRIKISSDLVNYEIGTNVDKDYGIQYSCSTDTTHSALGRYEVNPDIGLFVAGYLNAPFVKTLDGFVFAVPMFRLHRKASCGKQSPVEYSKIHPSIDLKKFNKLMDLEKVERVVSETIQGRSVVNLIKSSKGLLELGDYDTYWGYTFKYIRELLPSTTYTIVLDYTFENLNYSQLDSIILGISPSISSINYNYRLNSIKAGKNKIKFTTPSDYKNNVDNADFRLVIDKTNTNSVRPILNISNCLLLEGDWTNTKEPDHFIGLKSLGEDEGNLIKVKLGVISNDSFDPTNLNVTLPTVRGANILTSNNSISPIITGEIRRGDLKVEDANDFKIIPNLNGDESIKFLTLKGRTIQNVIGKLGSTKGSSSIKDNYWIANGGTQSLCQCVFNNDTIKNNTKYTLCYHIRKNTLTRTDSDSVVKFNLNNYNKVNSGHILIKSGEVGVYTVVLTTPIDKTHTNAYLEIPTGVSGGVIEIGNIMLIEGDVSNEIASLPYIENFLSVGELENNNINLKIKDINLFNGDKYFYPDINESKSILNVKFDKLSASSFRFYGTPTGDNMTLHFPDLSKELQDGKRYILTGDYVNVRLTKIAGGYTYTKDFIYEKSLYSSVEIYFQLPVGSKGKFYDKTVTICLSDFDLNKGYVPYFEYNQNLYVNEPLRSLPNGVCDYIDGNKVIRKVGKLLLNGTETWSDNGNNAGRDYYTAYYRGVFINNNFLCDTIPVKGSNIGATETETVIGTSPYRNLYINLPKSYLNTADTTGVKEWFSNNPTTVYYELATPITEYIKPVYDYESMKTYQLDAPLRSLPNGVCDEIVNGKLIRRCGEVTLTHNSPIVGRNMGNESTTISFSCNDAQYVARTSTSESMVYCDIFNRDNSSTNGIEGLGIGASGEIYVEILRSKLTSQDVTGFKEWLKVNPIRVVFELVNPIEISLKEINSNNSFFNLQRQFVGGNWLRELKDGVRDTIENGKVIRRVGEILLDRNTSWIVEGVGNGAFVSLDPVNSLMKPGGQLLSDTPCYQKVHVGASATSNPIGFTLVGAGTNARLRFKYASEACTIEGVKALLTERPIRLLYELKNPVEEELNATNNTYYPYHSINTYCGSLYLCNGNIEVYTDNSIKTDLVRAESNFRIINNKSTILDTKYKMQEDAYNTLYRFSSNKNLLNLKKFEDSTGCITLNYMGGDTDKCEGFIFLKKGTYTFYGKIKPGSLTSWIRIKITKGSLTPVDLACNCVSGYKYTFTITESGIYRVGLGANTHADAGVILKEIQIEEGSSFTSYVACEPITTCFENIEEGDIEDIRHLVSLTGFNYQSVLEESFNKLLRGEL